MRLTAFRYLMIAFLVVGASARPAFAASGSGDPSPSSSPPGPIISAQLVSFPAWMSPSSDITATVSVTNHTSKPLTGISIHIDGYAAASTRSALDTQIAGKNLGGDEWSDSELFGDTIDPGQTHLFGFDLQKTPSTYAFFRTLVPGAADRAYPVKFTVDVNGVPESTMSTELIYFQEAQVAQPLQLSLVIPLDTPTVFDPQDRETSRSLEKAIAPEGRIYDILAALQDPAYASVPVALAPTGKLLDSLAILGAPGGFTRVTGSRTQTAGGPDDPVAQNANAVLQALEHLAAKPNVRLINTPYSSAPLPALLANGFTSDVDEQVQDGRSTVQNVLKVDPLPGWLLPTDGLLDDATLGELAGLNAATRVSDVILSPTSLQQPTTPPTLTPNAWVSAVAGKTQASAGALVEDSVLASRLNTSGDLSPVQVLQQFLAESATIQQERPGVTRSVAVITPADWAPSPGVLDGVLGALVPGGAGAPWLTGVTPDMVSSTSTAPVRLMSANVGYDGLTLPPKSYFDALRTARAHLDEFKSLSPPEAKVNGLARRLLFAESEEWWGKGSIPDGAKAFARFVTSQVNGQLALIQVGGGTVTLTSHGAPIPLTLSSGVDYPIKVEIYLASDRLTFSRGEACPALSPAQAACLVQTVAPGRQTIELTANANSTGQFPVRVELRTVTNVTIAQGSLLIRSTAYNIVALVIVGAAALFLLFIWVRAFLRRRLAGAGHTSGSPAGGPPLPPTPTLEGPQFEGPQ